MLLFTYYYSTKSLVGYLNNEKLAAIHGKFLTDDIVCLKILDNFSLYFYWDFPSNQMRVHLLLP